ncbi:unnamed protein product, partial [Scytosiphon promiscuus]
RDGGVCPGDGGGGQNESDGSVAPVASGASNIPIIPDVEAAAEAWLQNLMQGVAANDAEESAWQQEHQRQQQLDMELSDTPPGTTHACGCRQQQQQQQQQRGLLQAAEPSFGPDINSVHDAGRHGSSAEVAPATLTPTAPAMPRSLPMMTKNRSSSTCSSGAAPPEDPGTPGIHYRSGNSTDRGGSGGG